MVNKQTKLNTKYLPVKRRKPYDRYFTVKGGNTNMADSSVLYRTTQHKTSTRPAVQIFVDFYYIIHSLASRVMCILGISGASSSLATATDAAHQRETTRSTYSASDRVLSFSECRTSAILMGLYNYYPTPTCATVQP
uniref:Uncharacterized protein n=1 Tax=Schizaphis graminum TaxID=13262 RepID=A0A2S2P0C7_SCHGA